MISVQQSDHTDKPQVIFAPTRIYWGTNDEIYPCGEVKLPDLVRTRGKVGERLAIDPGLVLAFQMAAILVVPVIHLDAPRRQPMTGYLHLMDMVKHGRLEYGADDIALLVFPAAVVRYPEKKTKKSCNARRPKGA
jgi:hypothetical protein